MTPVNWLTALVAILCALITSSVGWYTVRSSSRAQVKTNELDSRKVDSQAFENARASYELISAQLRAEVDRLTTQVNALRETLERVTDELAQEESETFKLRRQNSELSLRQSGVERVMKQLFGLVQAHDIQVPAPLARQVRDVVTETSPPEA